tara:strand:- start:1 stop:288 length:288 start_codon:yes stop_codon:yes gene_type:complete
MSKHIGSFKDYVNSTKITEAEKEVEVNQKIKDFMEKAKEMKQKASESKQKYEELVKASKETESEFELLKYKKFRAHAELAAAEAKLLKKGASAEE